MSRKLKLALRQAAVLADSLPPRTAQTGDPTTTVMLPSFAPPMSVKEALLTDSRWVNLDEVLRRRDRARQALADRMTEEGTGLDHVWNDSDHHGSGKWVDGEYQEDPQ